MSLPATRVRIAAAVGVLGLVVAGCAQGVPGRTAPVVPSSPPAATSAPSRTPSASATPAPVAPRAVTVTFSGDHLWHRGLLADAAAAGAARGVDHDFEPVFEHIRPLIEDADLSLCHVEVPVTPDGVAPAGYPVFAAPPETIAAVAAVGFDFCTVASNHTLDQGFAGVVATLDALDRHEIPHAGSYRTAEAALAAPALVTTAAGVTVAVVTGTYGSNSPWPVDKPWAVDRLDVPTMIARGEQAREAGADLVLAAVHAGTEHQHAPNGQQREVSHALARSGVFDFVYGHHAHVAQPWERVEDVWVSHGTGNLVAQMKVATPRAYEQYLGRVTFVEREGRWHTEAAEYVPLLVTLSGPGAPARVLDVNQALADGIGDAERLRVAKREIADAVTLLGADVVEVGG